ncbi:MAG: hypothetical protein GY906_36945 [bacterium]|nr:hypothetical protein [bacterium]
MSDFGDHKLKIEKSHDDWKFIYDALDQAAGAWSGPDDEDIPYLRMAADIKTKVRASERRLERAELKGEAEDGQS